MCFWCQVYGDIQNEVTDMIALIAFLPILFNSALTPMLYVYRLSTFRAAIKKIFCKDRYLQEKRVSAQRALRAAVVCCYNHALC